MTHKAKKTLYVKDMNKKHYWLEKESGSVITRKVVMLPAHSPRTTAKRIKMNGPKPWFYNHR